MITRNQIKEMNDNIFDLQNYTPIKQKDEHIFRDSSQQDSNYKLADLSCDDQLDIQKKEEQTENSSDDGNGEEQNMKHKYCLKGLSCQVKELVGQLGETSYKELADILITNIERDFNHYGLQNLQKEVQNLKRRVYDSINVMVALQVLNKKNKIIAKGPFYNLTKTKPKIAFSEDYSILSHIYQQKQVEAKRKMKNLIVLTKQWQSLLKLSERNKMQISEQMENIFIKPENRQQIKDLTITIQNSDAFLLHFQRDKEEEQDLHPAKSFQECDQLSISNQLWAKK